MRYWYSVLVKCKTTIIYTSMIPEQYSALNYMGPALSNIIIDIHVYSGKIWACKNEQNVTELAVHRGLMYPLTPNTAVLGTVNSDFVSLNWLSNNTTAQDTCLALLSYTVIHSLSLSLCCLLQDLCISLCLQYYYTFVHTNFQLSFSNLQCTITTSKRTFSRQL